MAQENLNTSTPNDGLGDFLRSAFVKVQNMFTELYGNVVFKVAGKDLSKNDFTDVLKNKLDGIQSFAKKNVQSDFAQNDNTQDDYIKNRPNIPVLDNYVLNGGYLGTAQDIVDLMPSGGGGSPVFLNDTPVVLSGGKTLGKYVNGTTIPSAGKTNEEVLNLIAKETIAPSAYVSIAPTAFTFNQKLAVDVTVNYSYSINSLGATLSNLKLERSRDNISWTELFSSSTPPASPYSDSNVNAGYIDNRPIYYRLTTTDSGALSATANSTVNFAYRSFLGYSATDPTTIADIVALGNSAINNGKVRTFTGVTAGVGNYTYYAYREGAGDLANVILDGSTPILGAFTKLTDISGTDAYGGTVTYRIYKSNADDAFTSNNLAFS